MISIIIPVYNRAGMLERSIRSVMEQSLSDWELILVDDGSTDGSASICDGFAAADPRIRAFHKPNGGVSSARNLGLDEARGEWLAFLDADDRFYPDALEKALARAQADSLDLLQFGYNRNYSPSERNGNDSGVLTPEDYLAGQFFHGSACFCLIRASVVREHKLRFDCSLRVAEDHLFIYEILRHSKRVERTSDVLYWYYENAAGAYANTSPGDNIAIINRFGPYKRVFPAASKRIDTLLLGCLFNLAHKSNVPAGRIAELWKLADVQYCAPWKSLGVKLFWHLALFSPKFATGIVRLLRRVFPGRK